MVQHLEQGVPDSDGPLGESPICQLWARQEKLLVD